MKMKKFLTSILFLLFLFFITSCGGDKNEESSSKPLEYKVTFDEQGGTEVTDIVLNNESVIEEPQTTREGYLFDNWYKENGEIWSFDDKVSSNITLVAHWKPLYEYTKLNNNITLTKYVGPKTKDIVIPDEIDGCKVTTIGKSLFYEQISSLTLHYNKYDEIESVTIGKNVENIEEEAFQVIQNLKTVKFNDKIKEIGNYAFAGSALLSEFYCPDSIESIGDNAFADTSVFFTRISKNVKKIGMNAFPSELSYLLYEGSKDDLDKVEFDQSKYNGVKIEYNSLCKEFKVIDNENYNYVLLNDNEVILRKVKTLDKTTLDLNEEFKNKKVIGIIGYRYKRMPTQNSFLMSSVGKSNVENIIFSNDLKFIGDRALQSEKIKNITLPESVEYIGDNALCGTKITEINLPSNVKYFGYGVFSSTMLTKIAIPDNYTEIPGSMFEYCTNLEEVKLPSSLKTIGSEAFIGNRALKKIFIPKSVELICDRAFFNCNKLTIYMESQSLPENWDKFYDGNKDHIILGSKNDLYKLN